MHRLESFKTHVVQPTNGVAFRVLVLRCSCGITVNTNWRHVRSHWRKHVHVMRKAAA